MRALRRKLLRDLLRGRAQVASIALVLAAAVALLVALTGAHRALGASRAAYYARTRFPDVFAHLGRAPEAVAQALRALPGVEAVETRLVEPALVVVPDMPEPAAARILSLPGGRRPSLDGLVLRAGRAPEPERAEECVVLEAFAIAHRLTPGATVAVTYGGRQQRLRVVGAVLSPEFVFSMAQGGAVPDDRRFAAVFVGRDALAAGLGARGTFDDVTLALAPGASGPEVVRGVDRVLARHGGEGARLRQDQPSHQLVDDELGQLAALATRVPALFLLVAVFLIHTVLGRLVATQREQIAALRALGYTRGAVRRHFLGHAAAIALLGSGLGLLAGAVLGRWFCAMYAGFFRFPVIAWALDPALVAIGVSTSLAAATAGALGAAGRAARLAPAEAMRPPAPARYRRGLLSRAGLFRLASPMGRMVVRELERRPARAAWSTLGLALATSLFIVGTFSRDTIGRLVDDQLRPAMGADLTVALVRPSPPSVLASLRHLPGVRAVEALRPTLVELRHGHRAREVPLTALPPDATLRRVLDRDGAPLAVPADGLMLGVVVAARLGVGVGDVVEVTPREGDRRPRRVVVAALSDELLGRTAYMSLAAWAAARGEAPGLSAASLLVDPDAMAALLARLATMPGVAGVLEQRTTLESFERTTASFTTQVTLIVVLFATVLAVGVIYNDGRVVLGERARELATLRVLGFTAPEVWGTVVGAQAVHLALGIPAGLWLGRVFAGLILGTVDPERFRLVVHVAPRTYALAALVVLASAAVTSAAMARRVARLDPISALKAND